MAIAPLTSRQEDIRKITRTLRDMRVSAADFTPGATVEISRALPIYRPGSLREDSMITPAQARLAGWLYLVFAEASSVPTLTAELTAEESEREIVAVAQAPAELMPCLRHADALGDTSDFELRIFEVPAADAAALWLHGDQDLFVDLMSSEAPQSLTAAAYVDPLNALLAARRSGPRIRANREGRPR